jgi:hypothetical protein
MFLVDKKTCSFDHEWKKDGSKIKDITKWTQDRVLLNKNDGSFATYLRAYEFWHPGLHI